MLVECFYLPPDVHTAKLNVLGSVSNPQDHKDKHQEKLEEGCNSAANPIISYHGPFLKCLENDLFKAVII